MTTYAKGKSQRHETNAILFIGIEMTWSSLTLSESGSNSVSLLFALGMLLFDTFLYLALTFYITSINPGKFGARRSPLFIFQVNRDFKKKCNFSI